MAFGNHDDPRDPKTGAPAGAPSAEPEPEPEPPRGTSPADLLDRLTTPVVPSVDGEPTGEAPIPVRQHQRRKPRADKGKPRAPKVDRAAAMVPGSAAMDVLERVLENIRKAQAAFILDGQEPENGSDHARTANLLLEEAIVLGTGGDVTEWLRGKVYGTGDGTD